MNIDKKIAAIGLVLIILLVAGFVYLDFGIAKTGFCYNAQTEKYSFGEGQTNKKDAIYLYVERSNPLMHEVENQLKEKLSGEYEVQSYANLKENYEGPVIAVAKLNEKGYYTPVYSEKKVRLLAYYSETGSTPYFQKFKQENFGGPKVAAVFNSSEGAQNIQKSIVNVEGNAIGVFTIKKADKITAEKIAEGIIRNLEY